ncbi:MAG: hypothetical protein AAGJ86_13465, partial [Pseudomonadota bacterium]
LADADTPSARTYLWQHGSHSGSLLRIAQGASVSTQADGPLRLVGIRGELSVRAATQPPSQLRPERYAHLPALDSHTIQCRSETGCLSYVSAVGPYQFVTD